MTPSGRRNSKHLRSPLDSVGEYLHNPAKGSFAPWMVRLESDAENGLDKLSSADAFQVQSVAQERLVRRLGKLSEAAM